MFGVKSYMERFDSRLQVFKFKGCFSIYAVLFCRNDKFFSLGDKFTKQITVFVKA